MPIEIGPGDNKPGIFVTIYYSAQGSGQGPDRRALIWGTASDGGTQPFNRAYRPDSQQDANAAVGRGSELAQMYAAAVSQPEASGAEIWLMPIAAPTGVASVYRVEIFGTPTGPGTITAWINGRRAASVAYDSSDTPTTMAAAAVALINGNPDLTIGTASNIAGVISIPYKHVGATGEDLTLRFDVTASTGVQVLAGRALFATTAVGAGSARFGLGALTVTTAIANSDTAATIAGNLIADWNADAYPLSAQVGASAEEVAFVYRNGQTVRRLSAAIITTTGTTVNLGSGATSGTGSASSLTYNGTLGTGAPDLTAAIAALDQSYRSWAAPWVDAATVSDLATEISNSAGGGLNGQRQQHLTLASALAASVAGAIATGATPDLTTEEPRFAILWEPDSGIPVRENAARVAAVRAAFYRDDPARNWNEFRLRGSVSAPVVPATTTPSASAQSSALGTYFLTPVINERGQVQIVNGRTASASLRVTEQAWSAEAQIARDSALVVETLDAKLRRPDGARPSLITAGQPQSDGVFDVESVKRIILDALEEAASRGWYNGLDQLRDYVTVVYDPGRNAVVANVPMSPVLDYNTTQINARVADPPVEA